MLDKREIDLLAALPSDPAYMLLLEKIQALIDEVTNKLYTEEDASTILPFWKALKTIYYELKYTPEEIIRQVEYIQKDNDVSKGASKALMTYLEKLRHDKLKEID